VDSGKQVGAGRGSGPTVDSAKRVGAGGEWTNCGQWKTSWRRGRGGGLTVDSGE